MVKVRVKVLDRVRDRVSVMGQIRFEVRVRI